MLKCNYKLSETSWTPEKEIKGKICFERDHKTSPQACSALTKGKAGATGDIRDPISSPQNQIKPKCSGICKADQVAYWRLCKTRAKLAVGLITSPFHKKGTV